MKINAKLFLTWDEQVETLNKLGNNFLDKNPGDKERVLDYLHKNNFQGCVDFFTPLLWRNLNEGMQNQDCKFIVDFQFNDLLQLFAFDQSLKFAIRDLLINVQERLRLGIVYHILKYIAKFCNNLNEIPLSLIHNKQAPIIANKVFSNKYSKQSLFKENNGFNFDEYYSFLAYYIDLLDISTLYLDNHDINQFYEFHIVTNQERMKLINEFRSYPKALKNKGNDKVVLIKSKDKDSTQIFSEFSEFFKWCKHHEHDWDEYEEGKRKLHLKPIDEMIYVLAKVFTASYENYGEWPLNISTKFFYKLNEEIQLQTIKKQFPLFYEQIDKLISNQKNHDLIMISTFISFLDVFRNIERTIDSGVPVYNFYDFVTSTNCFKDNHELIKGDTFWFTNKPTCEFINQLLASKNNDFASDYFKEQFIDKDADYYLSKFNNLLFKVYCQEQTGQIYFTNKINEPNSWHVPMFFLKDTINWLIVFSEQKTNFNLIINECFKQNNINNPEIRNRLHDYLFNKIIIFSKRNWK